MEHVEKNGAIRKDQLGVDKQDNGSERDIPNPSAKDRWQQSARVWNIFF